MAQVGWFRVLGLAAITSMVSLTLAAQAGDIAGIQQKLYTQFKLTTTTADRSDIVTAGDVVVIHKPGLVMYAVASPMPPSNTFKNGKIGQGMSGFGKDFAISMLTPGGGTSADYPHRPFVPEEKCWVTGIQVQKDGVLFQLYSDPYDDIRYYANLKIPFPNKKEVPSADAALQTVAEVLTVVPPDEGGQQTSQAPVSPAGNSVQGGQQGLPGEYTAPSGSRILLLPDSSFTKFVAGGQGHGQYAVDEDNLTLTFASTGFVQHFKLQGGSLLDVNTQQAWARTGEAPAPAPLPAIAPPPPPAEVAPTFQGTYFRKNKTSDSMELGPDGVFALALDGRKYDGNYTVQGEELKVWGPKFGQHKFSLVGNVIKGLLATWEKPAVPQNAIPAPAAPVASEAVAAAPVSAAASPAGAPPPTISIGQTMDQVTAGFGQPLKMANLGGKAIFYYKDMKVTFKNGKVSDVE